MRETTLGEIGIKLEYKKKEIILYFLYFWVNSYSGDQLLENVHKILVMKLPSNLLRQYQNIPVQLQTIKKNEKKKRFV